MLLGMGRGGQDQRSNTSATKTISRRSASSLGSRGLNSLEEEIRGSSSPASKLTKNLPSAIEQTESDRIHQLRLLKMAAANVCRLVIFYSKQAEQDIPVPASLARAKKLLDSFDSDPTSQSREEFQRISENLVAEEVQISI